MRTNPGNLGVIFEKPEGNPMENISEVLTCIVWLLLKAIKLTCSNSILFNGLVELTILMFL